MFIITAQEDHECEYTCAIFKDSQEIDAVRFAIKTFHEKKDDSVCVYSANYHSENSKTVLSPEYYFEFVYNKGLEVEINKPVKTVKKHAHDERGWQPK
jgi:hypothetical protein